MTETKPDLYEARDAKRKHRLAFITDSMEPAGWFRRRPVNYRLALLRRESKEPPRNVDVWSVRVPAPVAESYGWLKRRLAR